MGGGVGRTRKGHVAALLLSARRVAARPRTTSFPSMTISNLPRVIFSAASIVLALAAALSAAPRFGAADAAPAAASAPRSEGASQGQRDAAEARRVLTLVGGGFVRAKCRRVEAGWEYQDGAKWKALAAERVENAALERDLLAQAKELAPEKRAEPTRRALYADWLCRSGLLDEGVAELDRVLEAEPDAAIALGTCARLADFVRIAPADPRLPAGLEEWLRAAANASRALREVAVHSLHQRVDTPVLLERLARELVADTPRRRAFAALALRRVAPALESRALLSRALLDGSVDVRHEAALTLRAAADPAWVGPVVHALGSTFPAIRANAVEALGTLDYPSAVEPLIGYLGSLTSAGSPTGGGWKPPAASLFVGKQTAYVQDYDVEVAQGAAIGDPQVNVLTEGAVLDVRVISTYSVERAAEARRVCAALQHLTHANPGDTAAAWRAWWTANAARFDGTAPSTTQDP
jgi:hypothetical protein